MNFADAVRSPKKIYLVTKYTELEEAVNAAQAYSPAPEILMALWYEQGDLHPVKEMEPRFKAVKAAAPDKLLGIANVCNMVQLQAARSMGADFVMLGFTDPGLLRESKRLNLPVTASVGTLSEMAAAAELGADAAALTFADHFHPWECRAMHKIFPNLPLIAVYALEPEDHGEYILEDGVSVASLDSN